MSFIDCRQGKESSLPRDLVHGGSIIFGTQTFFGIAGEMLSRAGENGLERVCDSLLSAGYQTHPSSRKKESQTRAIIRLPTKPNLRPSNQAFTERRKVWTIVLAAMFLNKANNAFETINKALTQV